MPWKSKTALSVDIPWENKIRRWFVALLSSPKWQIKNGETHTGDKITAERAHASPAFFYCRIAKTRFDWRLVRSTKGVVLMRRDGSLELAEQASTMPLGHRW